MRFFIRIQVLLLSLLVSVALGQTIPRAGTRFTFAIPEGADNVTPLLTPSTLKLHILSAHDGEGVIWSPSGTMITFTFTANTVVAVRLPYDLMLLRDLGKSQRGIIVRTTQPVNLTFHDILDYAGEATQIWPDEALDTNYLIPGWGLWNDINENNKAQITVVARDNNTTVTVTPTVDCIGGERKNVPSTMTLQRGECYVIKADTTGIPVNLSLFGSRVSSDKPVSVLTSTTCAYVPLQNQACNQIIDHILPLKNVGTEFYISTPIEAGHDCRVLFISESQSFYVFTSGSTAVASGGRAEFAISQPTSFQTSEPVQCYLLTDGSSSYYFSDPSIVTVLPIDKYHDSLLWHTPRIEIGGSPMLNVISVIYPTANEDQIYLDNDIIGLYPNIRQISGTAMSAAMIPVAEGVHRISSPVPVFGTAFGFAPADAYSYVIMGKGPRIDIDTPDFQVKSSFLNGKTCEPFSGTVFFEEGFQASEDIHRFRLTVTYDPSVVDLISVAPSGLLAGLNVTIDTSTPGIIEVYVLSDPAPIVGSGDLLDISFFGKRAGPLTITSRVSASQLEFAHLEAASYEGSETFTIEPSRYNGQAAVSVIIKDVTLGDETLAHIILDDPINGLFSEVRIRVAYDHDLLDTGIIVEPSTKLLGWAHTRRTIDYETDEYIFTPTSSAFLEGTGTLIRMRFQSYVSRYDTTTVRASASFTSADPCPLDIEGLQGANLFEGSDTCSTPSIRNMLRSLPIEFIDITPNPTTGSVNARIRHALSTGDAMNITVSDLTGKTLWSSATTLPSSPEAHLPITIPVWIGSGTYMLTLEASGYGASRQIVVTR